MEKKSFSPIAFRIARFVGAAIFCVFLSGCGSVNIPLGSLWGSSSETKTAAAKTDDLTTGSIAPANVVGKAATETVSVGDTTETKTASTSATDKPFSLDAPVETTGSTGDEPRKFGQDDHEAVLATLGEVLPEKGSANSQPWKNETTGYNGMIVPMAQITEKNAANNKDCRDLLISYGKGANKDWYRGEGCRTGAKLKLSDVSPWRKTR